MARLRSSSLFSNQSMISITMDGAVKVILWRGIMMCIRVAVRLYTYPRSFSAGAVHISKKPFQWGDTYVIDILNPADEIMALMLVIAIDAANCSQNN